jgi:caffeoyl-CoA O-methyltransferase
MTVYNDQISEYIVDLFANHDTLLDYIWKNSQGNGLPTISVKPEEGRFLQFLVKACNVKKAVEIGTLGGYSGVWIARGLPADGKLTTLEIEPKHAEIARQHFIKAGLADRIEIRLGNALHTLNNLSNEGPFDFVFIDADKPGYPAYMEWAVHNLRSGGIVATHNAFRKGSIIGLMDDDAHSEGMREFNQSVADEPRLLSTIFPAGDGMLISVKTS